MGPTFDEFDAELKDLKPMVQQKAIGIAQTLVNKNYSKQDAPQRGN